MEITEGSTSMKKEKYSVDQLLFAKANLIPKRVEFHKARKPDPHAGTTYSSFHEW
jgi:hypothetical protein